MSDKILIKMAKFDFSAPVETITFYEDDFDEESSPSKKIKLEDQKTDNVISESTTQEVNNNTLENSEKQLQKITMTVNDCIIEYNLSDVNKAYSQQLANKEDATSEDKIDKNQNEQEKIQQSTNQLSDKEVTITKEIVPEKVSTATIPNSNTQNKDMEIMSSYLKKLMDTVSEYLLLILRAQHFYLHSPNTGNQTLLDKWKEHYSEVKYHYFKLAFTVVETIFIPQVKLYTFARSFIECTMRLANKYLIKCTYEQIESLYLEMLEWTKEKSKKFQKFALSNKATYLDVQSKILPIEQRTRNQNTHAHQEVQLSVNKSTNIYNNNRLQFQNQRVWHQRQFPVKKPLIHPHSTNLEETIRQPGCSSNLTHYHKTYNQQQSNTYGMVPQLNYCCNNYVYNNYSCRSHPEYIPRSLSGPCIYPNCGYCQRTQWTGAMRDQSPPNPVISQVTSLDPHYTLDTTL